MAGTIRFTPTEEDYVAALRLHFVRGVQAHQFWGRLGLVVVTVAVVATGAIWALGDDLFNAGLSAVISALAGCACLLLIIGGNFMLLPRRSRRLFRQQKSLHHETRFAWSDSDGRWTSERGNTHTRWDEYYRSTEGGSTILLYLNGQLFQFLPHRAFDPAQIEDLRATLVSAGVQAR
ncbi:MAG: YcxB family protein [Pseudomonadota bacterium]|nr:YcxB family protein [Pseudomonadota bacterium]